MNGAYNQQLITPPAPGHQGAGASVLNFAPADQVGYKVQLFVQCRGLKNVDGFGKGYSDPICFVYQKGDPGQQQWTLLGKTEEILDNLNPDFQKSFLIGYYFEKHQPLRFEVMDGDNQGKYELIGELETTLGTIMGSKKQTFIQDLSHPKKQGPQGKIILKGDSVKESNWEITMKLNARGLPSTVSCLCSDNNPFFEIYRGSLGDTNDWYKVYNSGQAQNTVNPVYEFFKLTGQQLCNSDRNLPILIKFMNRHGLENIYLGSVQVTLQQLLDQREFPLTNSVTKGKAGVMLVESIRFLEKPSFIDYLRSGWEINLHIAIDFTASNGESSMPSSLHYLGNFNQYEQAISSVGSILEVYDNDRNFPVYGFGGVPKFLGSNQVSHCFPVNGNFSNPEVQGATGILQVYRQNLPYISLSGPTYFSHILNTITQSVRARQHELLYNILLIITDGEIHDMEATKDLVVSASHLPLSIIIIGVGDEKFKLMKELDSDDALLRDSRGALAARDVVQFVKFKKYVVQGPQKLAEKVLKEVPEQLVGFMEAKKIMPNKQSFASYN